MNISENTIKELNELYSVTFVDKYINEVNPVNSTHLLIGFLLDENKKPIEYIGKTLIMPKNKEITIEYIMSKLSNDIIYKNFESKPQQKLLPFKNTINCYPTTYGIGVSILFSSNNNEVSRAVESKLNELGIEYKTEYSQAHWVFRYKISKSTQNIEKIKQLTTF